MTMADEAWSVSRLARTIKRAVEAEAAPIWVRGELTGVKRYPSGHWYFCLRDTTARVDCTLWRGAAGQLRAPLTDGMEVFALGSANVWEERTALRFNVTQILPAAAIGAQAQEVERIKQALLVDGLLDPGRKRRLPEFAVRVAVVTSIAGAAVHDVITVARRRWPSVEVLVVNSAVQGEGAAQELVAALSIVSRLERIDCCIIGRGGGGRDDLAAFNDELLCRAIAACPVPVISAVGHEVDVTLADLVADVRAATPSQAAEFALPDRRDVAARVDGLRTGLHRALTLLVSARRNRMERTRDRLVAALLDQVRGAERGLLNAASRLGPVMTRRIDRHRAAVGRLAAQLHALSPVAVLGRGYALARDQSGKVLSHRADFAAGQRFTLTVADGSIAAHVEES
ncbi:MAG TPA: exodeoxyribonuclease VII large subunit [Gemmatimonadales bacterium]|jgi:exodeoxyribonuclease VII large subunit